MGTIRRAGVPAFSASLTLDCGHLADLLRRHLAALGQLAHLGGHDGEALALLAGARRLDRRVQRQQVGLVGDVVDDLDLLGDLSHRLHRLLDRPPAFLGAGRGFVGRPGSLLGVLGVVLDRCIDILKARCDLLQRPGLLGRTLGKLLALALSWLLAEETEPVAIPISWMTSASFSTTALTWWESSPNSSRRWTEARAARSPCSSFFVAAPTSRRG